MFFNKTNETGTAFFIHLVTGHTWRLPLLKKVFCHMLLSPPQAAMLVLALRPTPARFCVVWFWGLSLHKSEAKLLMPHSENGNNSATWNWKKFLLECLSIWKDQASHFISLLRQMAAAALLPNCQLLPYVLVLSHVQLLSRKGSKHISLSNHV